MFKMIKLDNKLISNLFRIEELVRAERISDNNNPNEIPRPEIRKRLRQLIRDGYGNNPKVESLAQEYLK